MLGTNNIDHHRTGDVVTLIDALSGATGKLATVADLYERKAVLVLGADLALEHPLLSFQIRANYRHHQANVYAVTPREVREDKYAAASVRAAGAAESFAAMESLREKLTASGELVIVFDDAIQSWRHQQAGGVRRIARHTREVHLPGRLFELARRGGYGAHPELLPGFKPSGQEGLHLDEMLAADLAALWVVGANPLRNAARKAGFLVVQDMFLTETAKQADVVLPAASAYEKNGTVTNVTGEVQRLKKAVQTMGAKPDLEIMGFIAREMGVAATLGPWVSDVVFEQIRKDVRGYQVPAPVIVTGGAAQTMPVNGRVAVDSRPDLVRSDHNGLFASGTLGRYSKVLNTVVESRPERAEPR